MDNEVKEINEVKEVKEVNEVNEITANQDVQSTENANKANVICIVSAALMYGGFIVDRFWNLFKIKTLLPSVVSDVLDLLITITTWGCPIAGFVLMIYLRVKYPKHIGGKVLMWVTIAFFIMFVVCMILLIIACNSFINSCCQSFY